VDDDDIRLGGLTVAMDVSAGLWAVAGVGEGATVAGQVPDVFPAYARLFHPAYRYVGSAQEAGPGAVADRDQSGLTVWRCEVRWSEVAEANGRVAHPAMEWASITGAYRHMRSDSRQPGLWDRRPCEGVLPLGQLTRLADVLTEHTRTPERCWFGIWEGFGDLPYVGSPRPPRLPMPNRDMILLHGPLRALREVSFSESSYRERRPEFRAISYRSPSLWWPDDRCWCVVTDVDLNSTYIGASLDCVQALVSDDQLEVLPVTAEQTITFDTDTINPEPEGSYEDSWRG
jgi:hypothetical protein